MLCIWLVLLYKYITMHRPTDVKNLVTVFIPKIYMIKTTDISTAKPLNRI